MITNIYSVYDRVAETYSKPFLLAEKVAMRNFNWMAKEWKEEEVQDKEVHLLGSFNDQTGEIIPITRIKIICNLEKMKEALTNG